MCPKDTSLRGSRNTSSSTNSRQSRWLLHALGIGRGVDMAKFPLGQNGESPYAHIYMYMSIYLSIVYEGKWYHKHLQIADSIAAVYKYHNFSLTDIPVCIQGTWRLYSMSSISHAASSSSSRRVAHISVGPVICKQGTPYTRNPA
jgi:hypothetical protein